MKKTPLAYESRYWQTGLTKSPKLSLETFVTWILANSCPKMSGVFFLQGNFGQNWAKLVLGDGIFQYLDFQTKLFVFFRLET